jgi:hypothetical protein
MVKANASAIGNCWMTLLGASSKKLFRQLERYATI